MNSLAVTTLIAYLIVAGAAFGYGLMQAKAPLVEKQEQEAAIKQAKVAQEQRAERVPLDEPIHVDLLLTGVAADGKSADFNFKTRWGQIQSQWKTGENPLTARRGSSSSSRIDMDWCHVEIKPVFTEGRHGHYSVKLNDSTGALLGAFTIVETGKQVKPQQASTPGYVQRLVFFEPERRVTTYRILRSGGKKEDACAIVFLGKGYSVAEVSKGSDRNAALLFPEVKFIVLHKTWLEGNDINSVMDLVKRGV